ncbi:pilus assembly protein TadE [Methylobacterium sp. Leaf399]|uniref:TadE/TadG family type IV pilus assembly protein n=1 Tax=Methylobacterium sp. Leaf399 TaxID=1736364 RepID=UPI0006FC1064|nr:TadE/TadG family type IV pilus assembly protein [Methylobacterium sp. Leaf399]KQT19651.1 pilus assembly protein TadE [Methylobacterium sp. Leaf399]
MDRIARRIACNRGSTAVEFALVAPMLLLTIVFVMVVGTGLYLNQELDNATAQASRSIMTGSAQASSMTQSTLTSNICSRLPSAMDCADLIVNLYIVPKSGGPGGYYTFVKDDVSGLKIPDLTPGAGTFNMGVQGDYQYLQVIYPIRVLPSFMTTMLGSTQYKGSPAYLAVSTAVFRNEKY